MIRRLKSGLFCASLALMGCLAGASAALAGPVMTFGPEDQGMLKLEYKGQFQLLARDDGASPDGDDSAAEFNFRRNRIALMGAWGKNFGLYVQTEFLEDNNIGPFAVSDGDNSDFQILDAVARFRVDERFNVWVGKFKYNFTRENLEACEAPLTLDRSLLIRAPFVSTRDKGVAVWGDLLDGKFQYRADVMNGRNDSASSPDSNFRYTARAHVSLLDPETGYGYKGTYLGKKKVLTLGAAYQIEQDIAFANVAAQTGAVDYSAWTADLFFEYPVEGVGTFTVSSAYTDYDLDDAYKGADPDSGTIGLTGEKNGSYVKAGYLLPNLPLQIFGRYEDWSFAEFDGIVDQEVDWIGGGINYYFRDQDLKLTLEYSAADFDKESASVEDFNTFIAQLQVIF
ncbi:outer membrane channel protein [Desulfuromonas versatilis]|uniref:Outer membrane channel protein n=1 Tax=Desulfuromonas versatilis TaxID=2802975 RepID=A0ABM8HYA9_9BACT|nr:selenite/tellurite reduction operon porin ExtI [Desulfuromonas versatilis]BCR06089.1 outer membrane channel protein [Desulfuromonas versatilis]